MKIGVPGEFHEDRWQRTAEDSERHVLPSAREEGDNDAGVGGMKSEFVPTEPSQTYPANTVFISRSTRKELTESLISPHCLSEMSAFQSIIGLLQCAGRGGIG